MAQIWEYVKIALMNIRHNKGRSILTMLGIIIGISSVILVISIGNGLKEDINKELNSIAGGQIYVYATQTNEDGMYIEFDDADQQAIMEKVPHVKAVTPQWNFGGTVIGRKGEFDCMCTMGNVGLEYASSDPIIKGRYFTENDYYAANKVCILNESSAKILFGTSNVVGMTLDYNMGGRVLEYTIIGIRQDNMSTSFVTGYSSTVSMEAPITIISDLYGVEVTTEDLLIISESGEYSKQVAADTVRLLENRHDIRGQGIIEVQDFNDVMDEMNQVLGYVTAFVVLVAGISLLVGGIGVMNIMLVSVTERTREIGIRKSLGARTSSILLQFLSESAIITLLGGIIGILLGALGAAGLGALLKFSVKLDVVTVIGATLFSSAVGLFFGIYPARKAAKLSPIEALRHE